MISKTSLKKDRWSCTRRYTRWSTVVMGGALAFGATVQAAPPAAADLDQIRNGAFDSPIDPPVWQNGNAGAQNAHFTEGMSIGYRAVLTNLPTDGTVIALILEYDIKHSNVHALDYLTHFQRLEPHAGFLHAAETLDPRIGVPAVAGSPLLGDDTETIPAPSSAGSPVPSQPTQSYNDLVLDEGSGSVVMTIYNGTFSGSIVYVSEGDLMASQSASSIEVSFTADDPTVVLAWGGHIASRNDWGFDADGVPLSAGGIHGSPYHMRLIDWNLSNLGNQDRSLKAAAVFVPCPCEINGPQEVCPLAGPFTYEGPIGADFTYLWMVTGDGNIVGANNQQTVLVQPKGVCGGAYIVELTVTCGAGGLPTTCELPVDTVDNDMPNINCPGPLSFQCLADVPPCNPADATCSDTCDPNPVITCSDGPLVGGPCGGTITRTYTCTDFCGNIASCTQIITVNDTTAPTIVCPDGMALECDVPFQFTVNATDNCDLNPDTTCSITANPPGSATLDPQGNGKFIIVFNATGTATVTCTATDDCNNTSDPCTIEFSATCVTDEGCTPGFWKNHLNHWGPTGHSPNDSVESVFVMAILYDLDGDGMFGEETLLEALDFMGGRDVKGAARILLRAAVAALLNASHPDVGYALSEAQIVADVNLALASMDRDQMLDLAGELNAFNNAGCPLD